MRQLRDLFFKYPEQTPLRKAYVPFRDEIINHIHKQRPVRPKPVAVNKLIATQDWLSNDKSGGNDQIKRGYKHPVIAKIKDKNFIIDGHHRAAKAYLQGRKSMLAHVHEMPPLKRTMIAIHR